MVRPSVASLNWLAGILHQAQPLYRECRLILNYLDGADERGIQSIIEQCAVRVDPAPCNKDADSIPQSILEPMALYPIHTKHPKFSSIIVR